jgi:CheY-like chemotaxis protein
MEKLSVLVVEDEPNIQQTLSVVLTLVGFKAHCASTVEEALGILAQERVDAVSLDIRLPDPGGLERDGLTLLKYLRSVPAYADVPVLLFTGVDLKSEDEALIAELHAKVFSKPQPYAAIIDELNRVLTPAA